MSYEWAIWKSKVDDGAVRFVHENDLPDSGFASVYRYSESDAKSMQAAGTYKHFKGVVHNQELLVDSDSEEVSDLVEFWLRQNGVGYKRYTTGNRGKHFHICRESPPTHLLPEYDKVFVENTFKGADLSIYHHVAMYRRQGCTHQKTGLKKQLEAEIKGKPLQYYLPASLSTTESVSREFREGTRSVFSDRTLSFLTIPAANGHRHAHLTKVAVRLDQLKQPMSAAFYYLMNLNLLNEPPLPEEDLRRIVNWAYNERCK